jgi:hypothetical protein
MCINYLRVSTDVEPKWNWNQLTSPQVIRFQAVVPLQFQTLWNFQVAENTSLAFQVPFSRESAPERRDSLKNLEVGFLKAGW